MASFDLSNFKTINTIIEHDSKDATYKFALLRGAIEISQEYSPLKKESGDLVTFPLGLLIEKWLLYYYPVIEKPGIPTATSRGISRCNAPAYLLPTGL